MTDSVRREISWENIPYFIFLSSCIPLAAPCRLVPLAPHVEILFWHIAATVLDRSEPPQIVETVLIHVWLPEQGPRCTLHPQLEHILLPLIDHGFDPLLPMVYNCFNYYLLYSRVYLVFWKKVMILEHFGDIWRKHPSWPSNTTIGRYWRRIIDRCSHLDIDQQRSEQKARFDPADLEPKSSPIYKITPDEF